MPNVPVHNSRHTFTPKHGLERGTKEVDQLQSKEKESYFWAEMFSFPECTSLGGRKYILVSACFEGH